MAEANRASFHIKSAPKEGTLVEIAFPAAGYRRVPRLSELALGRQQRVRRRT